MANTEVGAAYVSVVASMKGFEKTVSSGVRSAMSAAGKAAVAAAASSAAAVGKIVQESVSSFADYQQLSGGMEKLYTDISSGFSASDTVIQNAKEAYATLGLSANQYMEQASGFAAALKQSFGGDVVKAAESTQTAITDMADNVSVFGSNVEDVQNAYQGFAKQNYTMLDNLKLGYGGTKEEMERLISDANEYEKAQGRAGDLTIEKFGDVVQAIHDVQEEQGIAGNAADEALHTVSGSLDSLKAAWSNWLAALGGGGDVQAATQALVDKFGVFAENLVPVVAQAVEGIIASLPTFVEVVGSALGSAMEAMEPDIAAGIADAWNGAVSTLDLQMPTVDAGQVQAGMDAMFAKIGAGLSTFGSNISSSFMSTINSLGLSEKLAGLGQAASSFYTTVLVPLGNFLSGPFASALGVIGGALLTGIVQGITWIIEGITSLSGIAQGVTAAVVSNVSAMVAAVTGAVQFVAAIPGQIIAFFEGIPAFFTDVWQSVVSTVEGAASSVLGAVASIPGAVWDFICGIPGSFESAFDVGGAAESAVSAIGDWISGLPASVADWISGIPQAFSDMFSQIHIPTFHIEGGFNLDPAHFSVPSLSFYGLGGFTRGATAIVGERGTEFVWPSYGGLMDRYAAALVDHMDVEPGGGTTNVYINGARINDRPEVEALLMEFLTGLRRLNALQGA